MKNFLLNNIDGFLLLRLDDAILLEDLKISDANDRKSILLAVSDLGIDFSDKQVRGSKIGQRPPDVPYRIMSKDTTEHPLKFEWNQNAVIGLKVECFDTTEKWEIATVVDIHYVSCKVLLHFCGKDSSFDEWLPFDSRRIREHSPDNKDQIEVLLEAILKEETVFKAINLPAEEMTDYSGAEEDWDENHPKPEPKKPEKQLKANNFVSAYSLADLRHKISDKALFAFCETSFRLGRTCNPEVLVADLGIARSRARRCFEDFSSKLAGLEVLAPKETENVCVKEENVKTETKISKRRKRSRRTTAMLTEDWKDGNRRGLWKCPKCAVVLTAQKRYSHPCFRDNLLTTDQYNQSLGENQFPRRMFGY